MSPQLPLSLDPCTHDSWSSGDLTLSTLFPDLSSISDSGGSFLSPGADGRTTLMLRRVPRRYTLDLLRLELDSLPELQGSYDLLYLPMDSARVTNKGYAFINLKNQSQVCYVYMMLDGYVWKSFNSVNKRCKVCFAHIQGRESTSAYIQSKRLLQENASISNENNGPNHLSKEGTNTENRNCCELSLLDIHKVIDNDEVSANCFSDWDAEQKQYELDEVEHACYSLYSLEHSDSPGSPKYDSDSHRTCESPADKSGCYSIKEHENGSSELVDQLSLALIAMILGQDQQQ